MVLHFAFLLNKKYRRSLLPYGPLCYKPRIPLGLRGFKKYINSWSTYKIYFDTYSDGVLTSSGRRSPRSFTSYDFPVVSDVTKSPRTTLPSLTATSAITPRYLSYQVSKRSARKGFVGLQWLGGGISSTMALRTDSTFSPVFAET